MAGPLTLTALGVALAALVAVVILTRTIMATMADVLSKLAAIEVAVRAIPPQVATQAQVDQAATAADAILAAIPPAAPAPTP
jgi:hypothetical protein